MKSDTNLTYLNGIKFLLQTKTVKQIIFMVGVAISVALGIVLYTSVEEPMYRPLDYQVNSKNMAVITDTLDKAGIQYKINDKDNMVYVAAEDVQIAKLKLASTGIQKDDSFSYAFLNDQSNYANSQFVENARYLRALESDLSKTVGAIEGVQSARVHIAIPQHAVFLDENSKVTASVVLAVSPVFLSDKEKIRSIMQIISGSVPQLDPRDVSITDQYGHLLSDGVDQDNIYNSQQLNYQNSIQSFYEKRIQSLISPMLGENKVSVKVFADIDFTQNEEAQEQYDPDKKAVSSEQVSTEQNDSSKASGAPGSLSNAPPGDSDSDKAAGSQGGVQGKTQSIRNYDVGKSVTYRKSNAAKIKSISVAIVVDNEMVMDAKTKQLVSKPLDQDKMNQITSLVQAMIGYDQTRGDKVTVVNSTFIADKVEATLPAQHAWEQAWFWETIKKTVGIIIGFIFLLIFSRKILNHLKNSAVNSRVMHDVVGGDLPIMDQGLESIKQQRINQLKHMASTEPGKIATVIKNWVGKT